VHYTITAIHSPGRKPSIVNKLRILVRGILDILQVEALHQGIQECFGGLEAGEIPKLPEDLWITDKEPGQGRQVVHTLQNHSRHSFPLCFDRRGKDDLAD
jgi:hypothetical protein